MPHEHFSKGYGQLFREVYIDQLALEERAVKSWFETRYAIETAPSKGKRGRKPQYDWCSFHAEAIRILEDEGRIDIDVDPNFTQAAIERQMITWCETNPKWGKAPVESEIRKHVKLAMKTFTEQRADN
jgi:hypothetical protein